MKKMLAIIIGVLLVFSSFPVFLPSTNVQAKEPQKSIVVPDDFETILEAIYHAESGSIIFVRNGTYEVPEKWELIIDKPLTIIGECAQNTTLTLYPNYTVSSGHYCSVLTVLTDDFQLSGLNLQLTSGGSINGFGDRIQFIGNTFSGCQTFNLKGSYCQICDNNINSKVNLTVSFTELARNTFTELALFEGHTNIIQDNTCNNVDINCNFNNLIMDNKIRSSGHAGLILGWSNDNFLYRNYIRGFDNGIKFVGTSNNVFVANSISFSSNMHFYNSQNSVFYYNNLFANFGPEGFTHPTITDDHNIKDSNIPVSVNFWDNGTVGNRWYGTTILDNNGDGIGELPYRIDQTNIDNYPLADTIITEDINVELPPWVLNTTDLYPKLPMTPKTSSDPQIYSDNKAVIFLTSAIIAAPLIAGTLMAVYYKKRKQQEN